MFAGDPNSVVMPTEESAGRAITLLSDLLNTDAHMFTPGTEMRVSAAIALLNAYATLRTWEKPVGMIHGS